jgi:hypothetical protein
MNWKSKHQLDYNDLDIILDFFEMENGNHEKINDDIIHHLLCFVVLITPYY